VLAAVAGLYAAGADFLWARLAPTGGNHVRVPTYAWQRQRLWLQGKYRLGMEPVAKRRADAAETDSPAGGGSASVQQPATAQESAGQIRARPDLTSPYVAPRDRLEEAMGEAWSALLRIDRVGVHDNFFALGGDSLQATILLNRLQEDFGEAVPSHVLFQVQTIHDLATYLRCHCPNAIRRRYPEEAGAGNGELASCAAAAAGAERGDGETMPGVVPSIPRLARDDQAEQLLARLDELSDDEVQSLLDGAMAGEEEPGE
jgi:acyl carrier protein